MPGSYIKFYGVRGSLARPGVHTSKFGGNTTCLEVRCGNDLIICDCGTGIFELGRYLAKEKRPLNATILFSHYHWDHMLGLPFFLPIHQKKNRFTMIGRRGLKRALYNLFKAPNFPVKFSDLSAKVKLIEIPEKKFKIGKILIDAFDVHHPNGAFGFRFTFPNKKSLVFISDNGPEVNYRYLIDKISGADVLIHDAQYLPEEYLRKYKFGHSPFNYILDLARRGNVKKAFLFHHDPSRTDREVALIERTAKGLARRIGLKARIIAAREGMVIKI